MKKLMYGIFFGMISSVPVYAKYITPLEGPGVEITRIFIHESGSVSLYILGEVQNLDKCTATYRVYIPNNLPGKDAMLSVALSAKALGAKIGIHGSGCSITPFWGGKDDVPLVDNLWMF